MELSSIITNTYERKARLYPALLLIAPIVVVGATFFRSNLTGLQWLLSCVVGCGGVFLLTQLARDAGKGKEKDLFVSWGGMPSITIFRHRDKKLSAVTKERYHKMLTRLVKETMAPSAEDEKSDPDGADAVYSAWSNFLRINTRDQKSFKLLFQENTNYGYRRNVWGLRPIGISISAVTVLVSAIQLYLSFRSTSILDKPLLAAGCFGLLMLGLWVFRFTKEWVRVPADAYAERLAESVEELSKKPSGEK